MKSTRFPEPELYRDDRLIFLAAQDGLGLLSYLSEHGIEAAAEVGLEHAHLLTIGPDGDLDRVEALMQQWASTPQAAQP